VIGLTARIWRGLSPGESGNFQSPFSFFESLARTFAEILKKRGKLHVLVNNAGVAAFEPLVSVTAEEFRPLFNLNALVLLLSTQAGVKPMSEGGSVINIGSSAGSMPAGYASIYSATKGAVNRLPIFPSEELGPKQIPVNALNPGLVVTEGVQAADFMKGETYDNAVKGTPFDQAGQSDDIRQKGGHR
jgi:3-oxoacyl-[acyl-carrier protein] reductase